jgi:signal transduction histidine kinase
VSKFKPADASGPGQRGAGSALAPRNWPVASWLLILAAIPTALGLVLAGVRVTAAMRGADAYGQIGRLAVLGQQVTGLAQAMEDERADTAAFIADGRPAAGISGLRRQIAITDGWAASVRRLAVQAGPGYPAQTRAGVATVLASVADLPGLRRRAAQRHASALAVIRAYSAATAGLSPVSDGIADLSDDSALISSVRALGALARMTDQASQQQAILGAALARGRFEPGALTALTVAQAQEASDLASFRGSATPEESWALDKTLSAPPAAQARAVEQGATAGGNGTLALGPRASQQWGAGMSYTVGWMRGAEEQLARWVTTYSQALQRSAVRSAMVTGGAALAVLLLVLLATMIIARSIVRPLRRLEAAALDVAEARLPGEIRALGVAGDSEQPVAPIDVRSAGEIGHVARAFDRMHTAAVRLAGEEVRRHGNTSAVFAGFFRRSHSLLERMLRLIDGLELDEDDPERLASLFQMDHLATRMRRNSDSAFALAGHQAPYLRTEPVTLLDVLRAAVSEIEGYDRVVLNIQPGVSVVGNAAADTAHLLAELLENAAAFSPPTSEVVVSGQAARDGGSLITIADGGTGLPRERLRQLNRRLAHPVSADVSGARQLGLVVVGHLAARHGIEVALRRQLGGGTTAEVRLPSALISATAEPPPAASRFAAAPEPAAGPETPGAEQAGALPIFESVEADYLQARGEVLLRPGDPQADQPAPETPAAGGPDQTRLPQRIPQAGLVSAAASDRERRRPAAARSAQDVRSRLASFQRGSRRARAAAGENPDAAPQPEDD